MSLSLQAALPKVRVLNLDTEPSNDEIKEFQESINSFKA